MTQPLHDAPADWLKDIIAHGVSREKTALCYSVRFSVWGRQLFVGNTRTQDEAAKLYDIALWKFLPKMAAMKPANCPDDFAFITQRLVDEKAPRLNALYAEFPFQSPDDANVDEEELRERRISGAQAPARTPTRHLGGYNKVIFKLKRLSLLIAGEMNRHEESRLMLPFLHKLPDTQQKFSEVVEAFSLLVASANSLCDSMERQRAYYSKIATGDERAYHADEAIENPVSTIKQRAATQRRIQDAIDIAKGDKPFGDVADQL